MIPSVEGFHRPANGKRARRARERIEALEFVEDPRAVHDGPLPVIPAVYDGPSGRNGISLRIDECPLCGERHRHGGEPVEVGERILRIAHCVTYGVRSSFAGRAYELYWIQRTS